MESTAAVKIGMHLLFLLMAFGAGSALCAFLAVFNAPRWVCIASTLPTALFMIWKGWL